MIQKMERQSVGVVETHRKNTPTRPVLKPNKSTSQPITLSNHNATAVKPVDPPPPLAVAEDVLLSSMENEEFNA